MYCRSITIVGSTSEIKMRSALAYTGLLEIGKFVNCGGVEFLNGGTFLEGEFGAQ